MKTQINFFVLLFIFPCILSAQRLCVKAEISREFPSFTQLKGSTPNAYFQMNKTNCPEIGVEYATASGIVFSGTVGHEKENFYFNEIQPKYVFYKVAFNKIYQTTAFIFSSGYEQQIAKSNFRWNTQAGIGFGIVNANNVTNYYAEDFYGESIDEQGQIYLDNVHVVNNVKDGPNKKISCQAKISLALEYEVKHFFVRSFVEARSWLTKTEEIQYHSEHSSAYYQYENTNDGHFTVRPGYLGVGIGVGWYFRKEK